MVPLMVYFFWEKAERVINKKKTKSKIRRIRKNLMQKYP